MLSATKIKEKEKKNMREVDCTSMRGNPLVKRRISQGTEIVYMKWRMSVKKGG